MTPELVVDATVVRRNIQRMADYARSHQLALRPHTKTHKSTRVGKMQLAAGAVGLTVAKVGEAEVMSTICSDLLLAFPTVDPHRCERVAGLAGVCTIRVGLDSALAAENLSRAATAVGTTVGVLVDVDLGYGRTGVQSDAAAVELGQQVDKLPGLRLDGIMTYTGHITGADDLQRQGFVAVRDRMQQLLDDWTKTGLSREIVSGGSTPAAMHCHLAEAFTEIRPGTYVYNDMNIVNGGYASLEDCAARIHATVISDAVAGQVVLDSGSKTLTSDQCGPAPESGFGFIVEYPDAKIVRLTEEHAQVDVSQIDSPPKLSEQVTVIPNHICVCVNMQNDVRWMDGDTNARFKIDARGLIV